MSSRDAVPGEVRVACHLAAPTAADLLEMSGALDHAAASVWAVLPEVAMRLVHPQEALPGRSSPTLGRVRNLGRALVRNRGPDITRIGPVLFLSSGIQTDRVLHPVLEQLANTLGPAQRYRLPPLNMTSALSAQRVARRAHREVKRWLGSAGIAEPEGLEEELAKAEVLLRRGQAAGFVEDGVRVLVVATQHNSPTRALLAAAANTPAGPATCYLPHAPVADNPFYRDLPFHYALLRGPAEVAFYQRCGAENADRIRVVGQPGFTRPSEKPARSAQHVVYAVTPYADRVVRADIEVILRGVDRPVEVCLHPRMSLSEALRTFPEEWTVHPPGATMEVLRNRGAFALIQHGSGVGLEAMSAGVDVIDLCPVEERPNYPYLTPPHVQLAWDESSLRCAIAAIPGRSEARADRVRFARSWCSAFDPEASVAAAEAIRSIAEAPRPPDDLLDGWRSPAPRVSDRG